MKNNAPGIHENEMQGRSCGDMGVWWNRLSENQRWAGLHASRGKRWKAVLTRTIEKREADTCSNAPPMKTQSSSTL